MKYIDTHTHYDHYRFRKNRNELMQQIQHNDDIKYVINATIGQVSMKNMRKELSPYSKVLFTVGKHPVCAAKEKYSLNHDDKQLIEQMVLDSRTVAIGETGIDTYRSSEKTEITNQEEWFKYFINLSIKSNKPLIMHIRGKRSYNKAIKIIKSHRNRNLTGVFHCFSEGYRTYKKCVKYGDFYFGIGGLITLDRKSVKKLRKTIKKIPIEKIVLETDCPFLKPNDYNEKINSSLAIPIIIKTISELKGISETTVAEIIYQNTLRLFGLS